MVKKKSCLEPALVFPRMMNSSPLGLSLQGAAWWSLSARGASQLGDPGSELEPERHRVEVSPFTSAEMVNNLFNLSESIF